MRFVRRVFYGKMGDLIVLLGKLGAEQSFTKDLLKS